MNFIKRERDLIKKLPFMDNPAACNGKGGLSIVNYFWITIFFAFRYGGINFHCRQLTENKTRERDNCGSIGKWDRIFTYTIRIFIAFYGNGIPHSKYFSGITIPNILSSDFFFKTAAWGGRKLPSFLGAKMVGFVMNSCWIWSK